MYEHASSWTPEAFIVLGVGIATVASQAAAVVLGNRVANKQLEASAASLRSELAAIIVAVKGARSHDVAKIHVHNGGRHPAINLRLEFEGVGGVSLPMLQAATSDAVDVRLGEGRWQAFEALGKVTGHWADGLGSRTETFDLLSG